MVKNPIVQGRMIAKDHEGFLPYESPPRTKNRVKLLALLHLKTTVMPMISVIFLNVFEDLDNFSVEVVPMSVKELCEAIKSHAKKSAMYDSKTSLCC